MRSSGQKRSGSKWAVGAIMLAVLSAGQTEAGTTARMLPSGDGIEVESQADGGTVKDIIPVYREGGVRHFSAGIGLQEREAIYPPFALKLVFTAGGKPYLTGVPVTIRDVKGAIKATIPRDHVTGPWLFVDLPPGVYHVESTYAGQTQSLKRIQVEPGKTKTLYLRWPEDRGVTIQFPPD